MILVALQILVSAFLVVVILLQVQGGGLSSTFGGGGQVYRSRRSVERFMVWATVILVTLFAILSIVLLIPR